MIKGLSPEEWTEAAIASLTDEALTHMTRTVATLFAALKREALKRGLWDRLVNETRG